MNFLGFLLALIIALLFTAIFFYGFRNRGPWGTFWSFFLIMFLVVWAAAIWFTDIGPVWMEVAWAPIVVIGIIMAVILASATPPEKPKRIVVNESAGEDTTPTGVLSVFFWITVVALALVIVFGLANTSQY